MVALGSFAGFVLTYSSDAGHPEAPVFRTVGDFESAKSALPASLKDFITDFGTWPKDQRNSITIFGLSFMMSNNPKRDAKYDGSLGCWIDCRTRTQEQRVNLINCMRHLQQLD